MAKDINTPTARVDNGVLYLVDERGQKVQLHSAQYEGQGLNGVYVVSEGSGELVGDRIDLPVEKAAKEKFLKKWSDKARKHKGLSVSVLILPLAACGGGSEPEPVFEVNVSGVDIDGADSNDTVNIAGLTVDGDYALGGGNDTIVATTGANITGVNGGTATSAEQLTLTGGITMTVAQHEAFSTVTAGGTTDQITFSGAGGATTINAEAAIETYVLAGATGDANTLNVNAGETSVDIDGADSNDTVNIAGLTVDGDYALGGGNDTIVATTGANITGVNGGTATSAEQLTLTGGITMTQAQHEALGDIVAVGGADQVTITTAGAITADDDVETYVVTAASNQVSVNAAGTGVNITANDSDVDTIIIGGNTVTGAYTTDSSDILSVTDTADITGVFNGADMVAGGAITANTLDLNDDTNATVTMTREQHESLGTLTNTDNAQTFVLTTAGTVTARDAVENYTLGGTSGQTNTFTVNSSELAVNVTASSTVATIETIDVNALSVSGTYDLGAGANTIELASGASTAGATISATSGSYKFVLDSGVNASVVVASDQLVVIGSSTAALNIDAADFDDTVTVNTARGALTSYVLDADIKTWSVGTTGAGDNVVTNGAQAQSVTFGAGNDTIKFAAAALDVQDTVDGAGGNNTIEITDDADTGANALADGDFDNVSNIQSLLLTGSGAQDVTLATHSNTAGIRTVTATAGNASDIDIGGTTLGLTVTTDAGNDTVTAGSGADNISTGAANDLIKFLSANFTAADTVAGGDNSDTIEITNAATVDDADFTNVTDVETLLLSAAGAQDVNFTGTLAQTAGIRTITATAGTASNIDISGMTAGITVSTNGGNDTVTAGTGNDNISTGDNNDFILFGLAGGSAANNTLTIDDTISAGDGTDEVRYQLTSGYTFSLGANFTGVELLKLYDGNNGAGDAVITLTSDFNNGVNVTIDASEANGGGGFDSDETLNLNASAVNSVVNYNRSLEVLGGAGDDTVHLGIGDDTVNMGAGNDRLFIKIADLTTGDTLDGDAHSAGNASVQFNGDSDRVLSTAHGLSNGDSVFFTSVVQTTGLTEDIRYFVTNATADDFQVSFTDGGTAVNLVNTDADPNILGTGSYTVVTDTLEFITNGLIADDDFTNVTDIEYLFLASGGNDVTLGAQAYNGGSGLEYIVSGAGNDTISFVDLADEERADITINLRSGGQDTITIEDHASVTGLGTVPSDTTLNATVATWNTDLAGGDNVGPNTAATIIGFGGGDNGDMFNISASSGSTIGGFGENVKLTTNNLSGLSNNSVIEISSNTSDGGFQLSNPLNLGAIATQLDQLNNLQDGTYFILAYNGSGADADAYLYKATATEGDGLDFADILGANGVDQDTLELVAHFVDVGGDVLTSSNFI